MAQWWSTHTLSSEYLSSSPSNHIRYSRRTPHRMAPQASTLIPHSTPTHTQLHTPHLHTQVHTLLKITAEVNKRESWKNYSQIREVSSTVVLAPQTPAQTQPRSFSTGESKAQCPNEKTHSLTLTRVARCYCGIFFFLLWNFLRFPLNGPITPQWPLPAVTSCNLYREGWKCCGNAILRLKSFKPCYRRTVSSPPSTLPRVIYFTLERLRAAAFAIRDGHWQVQPLVTHLSWN